MTRELLRLVSTQLEGLENTGLSVYHFAEPNKTQEVLAGLNAAADTWEHMQILLEGDWNYFEGYEETQDDLQEAALHG